MTPPTPAPETWGGIFHHLKFKIMKSYLEIIKRDFCRPNDCRYIGDGLYPTPERVMAFETNPEEGWLHSHVPSTLCCKIENGVAIFGAPQDFATRNPDGTWVRKSSGPIYRLWAERPVHIGSLCPNYR